MLADPKNSPSWCAHDGTVPLWRMLLDPRGRIARRTWWLYGVALPIGLAFLLHALLGIARVRADTAENTVSLLMLWPTLAVSAKRWHDRDQSAWWVLVVLVPVVGWLWALWFNGVLRGTAGGNRFGPDTVSINSDR
jgi:uncharacterized membrane protein YhaH (DUF805 family)